jgi:hypothetical protein
MNYRISIVASVLATCVAIGVAQSLHGEPRTRSRSACLERADRPTADELTIREAAARGLLAYSGIKSADPRPEEELTPELIAYGAF